jgi:TP901-1 family phage major tail protein
MAYQKGSDMLLKLDTASTGGPTFTTVAALQTKEISISTDQVDVTNQDSAGKWRELLAGAGITKASVSGSGVFNDTASEGAVLTSLLNGTIKQWQIIVPGLGTFQGLFQVTQCQYQAPHDKEVKYDIKLESAGQITFTAA